MTAHVLVNVVVQLSGKSCLWLLRDEDDDITSAGAVDQEFEI